MHNAEVKRAELPEEGKREEDKDSKHRKDTVDTDGPFVFQET